MASASPTMEQAISTSGIERRRNCSDDAMETEVELQNRLDSGVEARIGVGAGRRTPIGLDQRLWAGLAEMRGFGWWERQ